MKEVNQIRELAKEGLSGARIAKFLNNGRSPESIRALARRHNIRLKGKSGPPYENKNNQAIRLSPEERKQRQRDRCKRYRRTQAMKKMMAMTRPIAARGTYPFYSHRTMAEVIDDGEFDAGDDD